LQKRKQEDAADKKARDQRETEEAKKKEDAKKAADEKDRLEKETIKAGLDKKAADIEAHER